MHIWDKLNLTLAELENAGPINIVVLGDSVTHGYLSGGEVDYETVYWNLLKKKLNSLRSVVPVNMINAAIGGTTAPASLKRLDSQVLNHKPDLVIVCFGLNDVNGPLESFISALKTIVERCIQSGSDVIYMTPNMLNTYSHENTSPEHKEYSYKTAEIQNSGRMDRYMEAAVSAAKASGAAVCDCYKEWKALSKTADTTELLANYINHPTREMHKLFADRLFDAIFDKAAFAAQSSESGMAKQ